MPYFFQDKFLEQTTACWWDKKCFVCLEDGNRALCPQAPHPYALGNSMRCWLTGYKFPQAEESHFWKQSLTFLTNPCTKSVMSWQHSDVFVLATVSKKFSKMTRLWPGLCSILLNVKGSIVYNIRSLLFLIYSCFLDIFFILVLNNNNMIHFTNLYY